MVPVKELHVLVHPHANPGLAYKRVLGRPAVDFCTLEPRAFWSRLQHAGFLHDVNQFKAVQVLDRFYRREIKRIAQNKKAALVIVVRALPQEEVKSDEVMKHFISLQPKLVKFARKKLGKRLVVVCTSPVRIGEELEQKFSLSLPVKVFGEYAPFCVKDAADSLTKAGFNVETVKSKGVDRL